jgi:asparagine synthetase B (glutamine-hydrolysing)
LSDPEFGVQQTQDKLRTAIHRQLVADVPVGAFLSGGLDSSAIVAFGRSIVCSDYGIIKENIGEKDIYFNAKNVLIAKNAIKKLFQNQQLRIAQVNTFQHESRKCDWKSCYDRTYQVLDKCND